MKCRLRLWPVLATSCLIVSLHAARVACADSWEQAGGNAGRSFYARGTFDPERFEHAWTVTHDFPQTITGSWAERAVACDGRYVFQSVRTEDAEMAFFDIRAYDLSDGSTRWSTAIQARTYSGVGEPSVHNGIVFVNRAGHSQTSPYPKGSETPEFDKPRMYALDASDGSVVFATTYEAQWGKNTRATVIGDQALAGGGFYGGLYSFSTIGGTHWHVDNPLSMDLDPRPVVNENHVFAFGDHFYSRADGAHLGRVQHPDSPDYLDSPILTESGRLVYWFEAIGDKRISALDASTQEHLWDFAVGDVNRRAIAAGGGRVGLIVNQTNELTLLDESSGELLLRWRNGRTLGAELILTDSHAFVQAGDWLHAIDLELGESVWSVPATGEMALSNGYLLVSGDQRLVAYRLIPEPSVVFLLAAAAACMLPRRRAKSLLPHQHKRALPVTRRSQCLLAVLAAFCLVGIPREGRAAIVPVGDVSPAMPWSSGTRGRIGTTANGELTIDAGSTLESEYIELGYLSGVSGVLTVDGDGTLLTTRKDVDVGRAGVGRCDVTDGAKFDVRGMTLVGSNTGAVGTVLVDGAGSNWTSRDLHVGSRGSGTVTVANGGAAITKDNAYLGYSAGSTGVVTVDGSASTWSAAKSVYVGHLGEGTLNIHNQSRVTVGATTFVAHAAGSVGAIDFGENGGTLATKMIWVGADQLSGTGVIQTKSLVSDLDLVFDANHGLAQTVTLASQPNRNVTIDFDLSNSANVDDFGVGYQGSGSLTIKDGATVRSQRGYLGYGAGSTGTAIVTGQGSTWTSRDANSMSLFVGYGGEGSLTIANGAKLPKARVTLGHQPGSRGSLVVDGYGSALMSVKDPLLVGNAGDGSLEIRNWGTVETYSAKIGYESGSTGTVTVDGSGSLWTSKFDLVVGNEGSGILNITNRGTVTVGLRTYVGYAPGSTGVINFGDRGGTLDTYSLRAGARQLTGIGTIYTNGLVSDVDMLFDSSHGLTQQLTLARQPGQNITINLDMSSKFDDLGVGNQDSASLTIRDGVTVIARHGYLGYETGSVGTATVAGSGSNWTSYNHVYVGYSGNGTLLVSDGGVCQDGNNTTQHVYLGYNAGSTGVLRVEDAGSAMVRRGDLVVGNSGEGLLEIIAGGAIEDANGTIAASAHSIGVAIVDGLGSRWSSTSGLTVGNSGHGTLVIANGGSVDNHGAIIGWHSPSTGIVTVTGSGSRWNSRSSVSIGNSGSGTLIVSDGGAVNSVGDTIAFRSGSVGMAIVDGDGSTWTSTGGLDVGGDGQGTLHIVNGGKVANTHGSIGRRGMVRVDGPGSTWSNSGQLRIGLDWYRHGTLHVANGAVVTAQHASLENENCLLSIAVDRGSSLAVGGGGGAITNNGTVRIMAGAALAADAVFTPISAGAWTGTGVCQAVGGTWDALAREFTASEVAATTAGNLVVIDLSDRQRVRVDDEATGWTVGASFLAREALGAAYSETMMMPNPNELAITATVVDEMALANLEAILNSGETVLGAWDFDVVGAYAAGEPAYLSFKVGGSLSRDTLRVWHYDGVDWQAHDAMDLTHDGRYASFTVTGFSGYAVSGVPEPTAFVLLLAAGLCMISRRPNHRAGCMSAGLERRSETPRRAEHKD